MATYDKDTDIYESKEIIKAMKELRIDLNVISKYLTEELGVLKNELSKQVKDLNKIDDSIANLSNVISSMDAENDELKTANTPNENLGKLLSDDFKEREEKIYEEIEQILTRRFAEFDKKHKRKKIFGIF